MATDVSHVAGPSAKLSTQLVRFFIVNLNVGHKGHKLDIFVGLSVVVEVQHAAFILHFHAAL